MMKEKVKEITSDLTYDETEKILKKVEGIFKGGVTFENAENLKDIIKVYFFQHFGFVLRLSHFNAVKT